MRPDRTFDVVVAGAGPAGCAVAIRLAALGHQVVLIERRDFPRPHVGVALTPGVWPQLDLLGVKRAAVMATGQSFPGAEVAWRTAEAEFRPAPGFVVDRGRFDAVLAQTARAAGVRLLQPGTVRKAERGAGGWHLAVDTPTGALALTARLLVDAAGRRGVLPRRRRRLGSTTLALFGHWRGSGLPLAPRVIASPDGWFWGAPVPDGRFLALAFRDAAGAKPAGAPLDHAYRRLILESGMFGPAADAVPDGPAGATDATPFMDEAPAGPDWLKIGDAAFTVDPLSSSGVQKAIQSALAGSIAGNTLLRRPESAGIALDFVRMHQTDAAERHARWAAESYAEHRTHAGSPFWRRRSAPDGPARFDATIAAPDRQLPAGTVLSRSADLSVLTVPCIVGDFVEEHPAVCHPALDRPTAFLAGQPILRFLDGLPAAVTFADVVAHARRLVAPELAQPAARWLIDRGLLTSTDPI